MTAKRDSKRKPMSDQRPKRKKEMLRDLEAKDRKGLGNVRGGGLANTRGGSPDA